MHSHQRRSRRSGSSFSQDASGRYTFKSPFGSVSVSPGMNSVTVQRARRGDVRAGILLLLMEQPMHGYQIIQELTERSGGAWTPSAGSIYPALQLLADEGLVVADEDAGKKVFRLTEAGMAAEAELADRPAPWSEVGHQWHGHDGYRDAVGKLMRAVFEVGKAGNHDQMKAAADVLNDARKRLYGILAND